MPKNNKNPEANQPKKKFKRLGRRNWLSETINLTRQRRFLQGWQNKLERAWAEVHQLQSTIQQPLPGTSNTNQDISVNTDDGASKIETAKNMDQHVNVDEQIELEMTDETEITDLQAEISENVSQKYDTKPNVDGDSNSTTGPYKLHDSKAVSDLSIKKKIVPADEIIVTAEPETHYITDIPKQSLTVLSAVPIDNTNPQKDTAIVASKVEVNIKEEYNAADNNSPAELAEIYQSQEIEHQSQSTIQHPLPGTSNTNQVNNVNTDDAALKIKTVENMDQHENVAEQIKPGRTDWETQITDLNTQIEISENVAVDIETEKDNTLPIVDGDLNTNTGPSELHDSEGVSDLSIEKNFVSADKMVDKAEPGTHGVSDILNQSVTDNTSTVPIDNNNADKDMAIVASKVYANTEEEYYAADNNSPANLAEKHESQVIEDQSQSTMQEPLPGTANTNHVINVNTDDAALKINTVENMDQHVNLDEQIKPGMVDWETQITDLNTQIEIYENMEVDIETEKDNTLPNVDGDLNTNTGPSELNVYDEVSGLSIEKNFVSAEETVDKAEPETHSVSDISNQSITENKSTMPMDNNNAEKDIAIVVSKVDANIEEEHNAADNNSPAELAEKHQSQVIDTDETTLPSQVITENNTALSSNENENSTEEAAGYNTDNITELERNVPASCDILLPTDQINEAEKQKESVFNSNEKTINNSVNKNERSISEHQLMDIQTKTKWGNAKDLLHKALLQFLGFDPNAGHKKHEELLKLRRNMLPPCQFPSKLANCPSIFTSNWPTWMRPLTFRSILKVLTDFDYDNGIYLIDVLQYNIKCRMGAVLIKFVNKEDCRRVYDQLRVATLLNPKIKVELDIGNFILKQTSGYGSKNSQFFWRNPNRPANQRLTSSVTTIAPPENFQEDPHPFEKAKKPTPEPGVPIPSILTPSSSTPTTPRKHSFDYIPLIAITKIQDLLGLEHRSSLIQSKLEVEQKVMNRKISVDIPIPCHAIYMSNCPYQFEIEHYRFLLRLLTNFDWNKGIYYIDILQYSNRVNMGAILIKFASSAVCMKVFGELRRVAILQKGMPEEHRIRVQLDLQGIVTKARKTGEPPVDWMSKKLEPEFRARTVVTNIPAQKKCPDIDAIVKLSEENEINQRMQSEMDKQQPEQVVDDDDDVIILQAQSVVEIDLTEDDECIEANNKENSVNDLNKLISQELKDMDFNSMIEKNDTDSNSALRKSKENNNENTMAKIAALYSDSTKSTASIPSQNKTPAPCSKKSGNMDTTVSTDDVIECDSDTEDNTCTVVYVKNLPQDKTETILKELIDQLTKFDRKKNTFFIKLLRETGTNNPMGECLLKFNTHADAVEVAKNLNGVFVEKNIVQAELDIGHKVSKAYELDKENAQGLKRKLNSDGQQGEPKRSKFDETWDVVTNNRWYTRPEPRNMDSYGVSKDFLKKIGCKLPLTTFIIVKNLEKDVTEEKLIEVFSLAGNVKQVTLNHEHGKNSARIEYDHPVETVQAVSMFNHQKLYNTEMLVSNDNFVNPKPLPLGLSGVGKGLGKNGEPIRGVRTNVELQQVHEILYEMGRMNKYESKDQPFQAWYTKRTNPPPVSSTPSGNKIVNPGTKPNTAIALEALGAVLVSLDIIPSGTNCSDLNKIVEALSKNPKFKQNSQQSSNIQKAAASTSNKAAPPQIYHIGKPNAKNVNKNPNITIIPTNKHPPPKPLLSNLIADPNYIPLKNSNNNMPPMNSNFDPTVPPPPNCNKPGINPNMQPVMHGTPNMQSVMHVDPNMQPMMHGNPNMQPVMHGNPNMQPVMHIDPNMQPVMHGNPNMQPMMQGNPNMQPMMQGNPNMQPMMQGNPNMQPMMHGNPNMQPMIHANPNIPPNFSMPINPNIPSNTTVLGAHHGPVHPNQSPHPPPTHYGPHPIHPPNPVSPMSANRQVISISNDHVILTRSTVSKQKEKAQGTEKDEPTESTHSNLVSFHNLPPSVTTVALTAKMKEVGELQFSEVIGKGRALVRFKELSAAERCIRLFHRSKVDGHTIDVSVI